MRRFLAGLAVAVTTVTGLTVAGGSPAQAAGWTDCPATPANDSGFVCLWEGPYYTGARWQAKKDKLFTGRAGGVEGCYNLSGSAYTNGNPVPNTASSWAIRPATGFYGNGYQVVFFEWIDCNPAGNHRAYVNNQAYAVNDLSTLNPSFDNTVASIQIIGQ